MCLVRREKIDVASRRHAQRAIGTGNLGSGQIHIPVGREQQTAIGLQLASTYDLVGLGDLTRTALACNRAVETFAIHYCEAVDIPSARSAMPPAAASWAAASVMSFPAESTTSPPPCTDDTAWVVWLPC